MSESVLSIHLKKTGKVSDKWSSYLDLYDRLFRPMKMDPISMLEIGVQNGGSLETWSEYFVNARKVVGCDIDEKCRLLRYDDPKIELIVADCNSDYAVQRVRSVAPTLDLVIDDGSHRSVDIVKSFVTYFDMLRPGGTYVVEDTHTLYWQSWGGELTNGLNAYILFKKLIDIMNHQFWEKEMSVEEYLSDFFDPTRTPQFIKDGWIESIEFRNSIVVIRKALVPRKNGLGERVVTGTEAVVNRDTLIR